MVASATPTPTVAAPAASGGWIQLRNWNQRLAVCGRLLLLLMLTMVRRVAAPMSLHPTVIIINTAIVVMLVVVTSAPATFRGLQRNVRGVPLVSTTAAAVTARLRAVAAVH